MDERTRLIQREGSSVAELIKLLEEDGAWGGTPELRKLWSSRNFKPRVGPEDESALPAAGMDQELGFGKSASMGMLHSADKMDRATSHVQPGPADISTLLSSCLVGTPGLIIALVLNLFLSMSFGQAFFPTSWNFPAGVPRAIGVQMFLFSTLISQIVMTAMSDFPTAMGMMMVENIPFMHIIAQVAVQAQGEGLQTFSTVFVTFALSTIVVGIAFYLLGALKIGNAVSILLVHCLIRSQQFWCTVVQFLVAAYSLTWWDKVLTNFLPCF
jgi:hypothetical protein